MEIKEISEDKIIWASPFERPILFSLLCIVLGTYLLYISIFGFTDRTDTGFLVVRLLFFLFGGFLLYGSLHNIIFNECESITIDKKLQKLTIYKKSVNNITQEQLNTIKEIPFLDIRKIYTDYYPSDVCDGYWYPVLTTIQGESIALPYTNDESSAEEMTRKIRKITKSHHYHW